MSIESNSRCASILPKTSAEYTADDRFEFPHQSIGRLIVPDADSADEFVK
jgi:hypothetical protein